jgi:hypothetical protein
MEKYEVNGTLDNLLFVLEENLKVVLLTSQSSQIACFLTLAFYLIKF